MRPPAALATIVFAMFATAAVAQPQPAPSGAVAAAGERVTVTVAGGRQITGRFKSFTPESLALLTRDGVVTIPAPQVRRVIVKDPITDGAVIGALIGAVAGVTAGLVTNSICMNETRGCPGGTTLLTGIGAAAGALLGAGVDGLRHRIAYEAIPSAPVGHSPSLGANAGIGWVLAGKLTGSAPESAKCVETLAVLCFNGPLSLQRMQRHQGIALAGGGARVAIRGRVAVRADLTVYRSRDWTQVRVRAGVGFGW